jgi:ribosome recycling factor
MTYQNQIFKDRLKKIEGWLFKEYSAVHTGRATPVVLDNIFIENYGIRMPLRNISQISIEDPKTLRLLPWDKSHIKSIEVAVANSNLGLSVSSDGDGVRVIFPMLTTENRTKLVRVLKEKLEEARISVRKERQEEIEKTDDFSEDLKKRAKEEIQKCVDEVNKNLEVVFQKKETEIMN